MTSYMMTCSSNIFNHLRVMLCNPSNTKECSFQIKIPNGKDYFFLPDVVVAICNKYREIYAEEDATSSIKAENLPKLINRNVTNGKWGIKFHYLDELIIDDLVLDTSTNTIEISYSTRPSPSHR